MRAFFIYILFFLLCFSEFNSNAQGINNNSNNQAKIAEGKKVVGKVVEYSNLEPIELVLVRLYSKKDSTLLDGVSTDAAGQFNFTINHSGDYYITFNLIGYESLSLPLVILDSNYRVTDLKDIKLGKSTISLIPVKIIGATNFKIDIDKKIYTVDTNAISANGTATDVLQNIPSVFVSQDGTVTLRGGNAQLYINGKPSGILGISKSQILDYIPSSLIGSVEVINDPSARYDADGGSGIINIVLKNNKKPGINGMLVLGAGTRDKYNGSLNFNLGYKKLNVFASYDARSTNMNSWETKNRSSEIGNVLKYVDQNRTFFSKTLSQNARLRIQYDFNKRNSLSFSYLHSELKDIDLLFFKYQHLDSLQRITKIYNRNINEIDNDFSNNYTLNYTKKFRKPQQMLTADLFYSNDKENTVGDIYQQYFNLDYTPSKILPPKFNTLNLNTEYNYVGQIDYEQPIFKNGKIEAGLKSRTKNTFIDYQLENYYYPQKVYLNDTAISNRFHYNLSVNAAYLIFRQKRNFFSYKIGTRIEQSNIVFTVFKTNQFKKINYVNLFPSFHLLKELKGNNKLTLSYSRRIDRPGLGQINPLQQYNDPLFLTKGNPNLLPEYTNAFDFSHVKNWGNNTLNSSIYYQQSFGTIQRIILLDNNGVTTTNYQNLIGSKKIGAELNAYLQVSKWLRLNCSLNGYHNNIDGSNISPTFKATYYSWSGKINSNIMLWHKSILQIAFNYQAPTYSPFIVNYGQYFMDASFRQDFMDKRLSLSLRFTDILHSQKKIYTVTGSNFNVYSDFRRQSRILFIGLTFRPFGYKRGNSEQKEEEENAKDDDNAF